MTSFLLPYVPLSAAISAHWVAIEKFANIKRIWFEQYLSLENGIPSHDTLGRVFSLIDPEQFQTNFYTGSNR